MLALIYARAMRARREPSDVCEWVIMIWVLSAPPKAAVHRTVPTLTCMLVRRVLLA